MKKHYLLRLLFMLSLIVVVAQFATGQKKKILYVGADAVLLGTATRTCDKEMIDSLLAWGYDTLYMGHGAYDAMGTGSGVHDGIDGIFFSESVGSSSVTPYGNMGDNFPVPAVNLEVSCFKIGDEYWNLFNPESTPGAGDGGGILVHTGEICDQTDVQVKITDNEHYITEIFAKDQIITWSSATSYPDLVPYTHGLKVDVDILAVPVAPFTPPTTGAEVFAVGMLEDNFPKVKIFWMGMTHAYLNNFMGTADFYQLIKRAAEYTYDNMPSAVNASMADDFKLVAYPNPSAEDVTIRFVAPKSMHAQVSIFDVTGKVIDVVYDNIVPSGYKFIKLHADQYQRGMYFVKLQLGDKTAYSKLLLK
ncbi:MAG: T9SS type A sorting domain-containing protein [Bacteroidales bacterium]|nr:T9SS type A sorting domain-containing protein [Bacteroidales bacterium]